MKMGLIFKEKSSSKLVINILRNVPDSADVSDRTVQLGFKKSCGCSIKEKIRYERFKDIISYLLANQPDSVQWKEVIVQFGYYDHSHPSKDFKNFLEEATRFCVPILN